MDVSDEVGQIADVSRKHKSERHPDEPHSKLRCFQQTGCLVSPDNKSIASGQCRQTRCDEKDSLNWDDKRVKYDCDTEDVIEAGGVNY